MSKSNLKNQYIPNYLTAPGLVLEEYMEFYKQTPQSLADKLAVDISIVESLLKGDYPITEAFAEKFKEIFHHSTQFWLNLEAIYQSEKIRLGTNNP